jgi:hypothetical protein
MSFQAYAAPPCSYSTAVALADIIDNSITARAANVNVTSLGAGEWR